MSATIEVVSDVETLRAALATRRSGSHGAAHRAPSGSGEHNGPLVGFVPTMGYLHEGHVALVRHARSECDVVVASIFVNPTQFGPGEDFASYPRDLERDLRMLAGEHIDLAFTPAEHGFYPPGADTTVTVGVAAEPLEGRHRPGHFRGVATVVTMLLNAVQPDRAYFGEKDWQQLQVVRQLVRDLHMPVEVVQVPTVREADGLALSSRNVRLTPVDRQAALCIPMALEAARTAFAAGERSVASLEAAMHRELGHEPAVRPDYAVVVDAESLMPIERADERSRALIAARVGAVRLIDNVALG